MKLKEVLDAVNHEIPDQIPVDLNKYEVYDGCMERRHLTETR
jgi:hypothetical protein